MPKPKNVLRSLCAVALIAPLGSCDFLSDLLGSCSEADLVMGVLDLIQEGRGSSSSLRSVNGVYTVAVGDTVDVLGAELNQGGESAGTHAFEVSLRASQNGTVVDVGEPVRETVAKLAQGQTAETRARYVMQQAGVYLLKGVADVLENVCEGNESNNTATASVNPDGSASAAPIMIHVVGEFDPGLTPANFVKVIR